MELTNELKEKLQNAKSMEEVKKLLSEAGIDLTDEELDRVSGGEGPRGEDNSDIWQRVIGIRWDR